MRALELEFLHRRRAPGWASWLLLAVSLSLAGDVTLTWRSLRADIDRMDSAKPLPPLPRTVSNPDPEELAFARDVVRQLATPWDRLFSALEAAQSDRVALLAIEPDAAAGTVTVSAQARDYLAALTYVANLSEQQSLKRVHLARHEVARAGGPRPMAFSVQASWR